MRSRDRDPVTTIEPGDRWLVIVAHPDDETFGCGSLIADAARRGAQVTVVCATRGEAGERTAHIALDADLGNVRAGELHAAAALLGAARVELLTYTDSGFDGDPGADSLCGAPPDDVTDTIANAIGEVDPDVVAILDGSDGHRDHLCIRTCTHRALSAAPDRVLVLIETCLPNSLMRRWLDEMREVHPDSAYHAIDPKDFGTPDTQITDVLDHTDVLALREEAIALHRSQASPFDDLSPALRTEFLIRTHLIRVSSPT
jgi:N-acetyl-1-D-myo-inositol-2-amino-2-deoxy-alpha-D-glucopyranoside deacetylase